MTTHDPREALVAWRASTGYSQTEVGALFGVTKQGVGNWETSRSQVPPRVQARLIEEGWLTPPRRARAAPLNHTPLCPPGQPCKSCSMRRVLAEHRPRLPKPDVWTAEQDTWLLAHAGTLPLPLLAQQITAAFSVPRTAASLRWRLQYHGRSRLVDHLTASQAGYYCGVSEAAIRRWLQRGWLVVPDWARARQRNSVYMIPASALTAFIETRGYQLNPEVMPQSPFRQQAQAVWARDRWLTTRVVARYAGVDHRTVTDWIRAGKLPATLAPRAICRKQWMIRARDLAAFLKHRRVAAPGPRAVGR